MTKFNPENKNVLTYGECLSPAMEITDQADAEQYFEAYVAYQKRMLEKEPRTDDMTAEQICRINLGYFAGYYSNETRERVERLFKCSHPVFGAIKTHGAPSTQEALQKGFEKAQAPEKN